MGLAISSRLNFPRWIIQYLDLGHLGGKVAFIEMSIDLINNAD